MNYIKVVLFYVFYGVTVTQGAGLLEELVLDLTSLPIASQITSLLLNQVLPVCFVPFDSIGCTNNAKMNEIGGMSLEGKTAAFLFTERNSYYPEFLHRCGGHLPENTNFNPQHKTEIFIRGWLDGVCRTRWMTEMKNELLMRGSYNVILIDWTWGNGLDYYTGSNNTYVVGRQVASLIQNIMMDSGAGPESFHVVGHSFGAQIAGLAGKLVRNLRRITALDPALEPFQNKPSTKRLYASDANLVDVIHSNGGREAFKTLGDIQPLGDADFYPNGGTKQDSCQPYIIESLLKLDVLYAAFSVLPIFCNHLQSIQYYKSSINPKCQFVGVQCPDYESFTSGRCASCGRDNSRCALMGMDFEYTKHPALNIKKTKNSMRNSPIKRHYRKYYLDTTLYYPYCKN